MRFFAVVLLFTSLFSCSDSNDNNHQQADVTGIWRLVKVENGFAGINDQFDTEWITWTFLDDGNVSVSNTNTDDSKQDLLDTGSYPFGFIENESTPEMCSESLTINTAEYGCVSISNDTMKIDQSFADGYRITLTKLEYTTTRR